MSKAVKALSIILILAALFGLVGGGMSLKDALDSKDYFGKKGEETDAAFTKLEDGLAQLQENEQAYLDGRDKYEDGLKQYEEGKAQYEEGKKSSFRPAEQSSPPASRSSTPVKRSLPTP